MLLCEFLDGPIDGAKGVVATVERLPYPPKLLASPLEGDRMAEYEFEQVVKEEEDLVGKYRFNGKTVDYVDAVALSFNDEIGKK